MIKRIITVLLSIVICLPFIFGVAPEASDEAAAVKGLNALGLFNGVGIKPDGSADFALDRAPTRAEVITMLVRLIGKEAEAIETPNPVPFADVPNWALPYVGYAYANNLVFGDGGENFESGRAVSASEFINIILRTLGYEPDTDFYWDKAWVLSDEIGITGGRYNSETTEFVRGDVALIAFKTLDAKLKGSEITLSSLLIEANVFTEAAASAAGLGVIADAPVPLAERVPVPDSDRAGIPDATVFEREVFILINKERENHGLPSLTWDAYVANIARAHSTDMMQNNFFSHTNLADQRPGDRVRAAGIAFNYLAENIARGFRTSESVVAAWMASPSHRDAILSEMPERMGIGVNGNVWTVNFIK